MKNGMYKINSNKKVSKLIFLMTSQILPQFMEQTHILLNLQVLKYFAVQSIAIKVKQRQIEIINSKHNKRDSSQKNITD